MYKIEATGRFKKDLKKVKKRNLNLNLIKSAISTLEKKGTLPLNYRPHLLKGDYKGYYECHIQPDWLMIWEKNDSLKLITLIRTGTHSDLFN